MNILAQRNVNTYPFTHHIGIRERERETDRDSWAGPISLGRLNVKAGYRVPGLRVSLELVQENYARLIKVKCIR